MKDEVGGYDEVIDYGQDYKSQDNSPVDGHELFRG